MSNLQHSFDLFINESVRICRLWLSFALSNRERSRAFKSKQAFVETIAFLPKPSPLFKEHCVFSLIARCGLAWPRSNGSAMSQWLLGHFASHTFRTPPSSPYHPARGRSHKRTRRLRWFWHLRLIPLFRRRTAGCVNGQEEEGGRIVLNLCG